MESERDRSGCATDGPCQRSKWFLLSAATPRRAFVWEQTKAARPRPGDASASQRSVSAHGTQVNKDPSKRWCANGVVITRQPSLSLTCGHTLAGTNINQATDSLKLQFEKEKSLQNSSFG